MKSKKVIAAVQIIIAVLFLSIVVTCFIGFISAEQISNHVFTNIDDFKKLDEYSVKDINLEDDKMLKDIHPAAFYLNEISFNGHNYKVYAYEFSDLEFAREYFYKCTGKKTDAKANYSMTTNYLFSSDYIAYYENFLYRIEGGNYKAFSETVNFINNSFPIDLSESEID